MVLVPAGHVSLSDRRQQRGNPPLERAGAAVIGGEPFPLEHHQHERLSRALGAPSFQAQEAEEHRLGRKPVQVALFGMTSGQVLHDQRRPHRHLRWPLPFVDGPYSRW